MRCFTDILLHEFLLCIVLHYWFLVRDFYCPYSIANLLINLSNRNSIFFDKWISLFFLFFLSRLSCGLNCSLTDKYLFKTDKDWCKYFLIKFTFLIDKTNKYWTLSLPFCLCCFKQVRTWRYLNIYNCNENEIFWQDRGAVWWNLCEEFVFGVVMMFDQ